jgi:hypothetical protein
MPKALFDPTVMVWSEHPYRSCYLAVAITREVFDPVDRKGLLSFSSLKTLRQETKDIIVAIPA